MHTGIQTWKHLFTVKLNEKSNALIFSSLSLSPEKEFILINNTPDPGPDHHTLMRSEEGQQCPVEQNHQSEAVIGPPRET